MHLSVYHLQSFYTQVPNVQLFNNFFNGFSQVVLYILVVGPQMLFNGRLTVPMFYSLVWSVVCDWGLFQSHSLAF